MSELGNVFIDLKKKYLDKVFGNLNGSQKEAVFEVDGAVLILAGAGSGKTTVLVNRIEYMIKYGDAYNSSFVPPFLDEETVEKLQSFVVSEPFSANDEVDELIAYNPIKPYNILAITFTNKAANELKERLRNRLGEAALDINAGTFHSTCVKILRRYIDRLGYNKDFTIYDTDDSQKVMKEVLASLNLDKNMFPVKQMLSKMSSCKDKMQTPEEYLNSAESDYYAKTFVNVYKEYQRRLKTSNALDFDDLIYLTVRLFEENDDVLRYYQNRFKYIMVDEYQDTNIAQYRLVSLLSAVHKNLCVVGDDDQSIYRFRGATIENILSFEHQFENACVIRLEQNYRSTQQILDAANSVIKNNKARKGKELWTRKKDGEKINFYIGNDEREEVYYIARNIRKTINSGGAYKDNAILYRTNAQSANFERVFFENGIPYKIIGGHKFFERREIKDVSAYLNVVNNPKDDVRFKRIINVPKRGIGQATVEAITAISALEGISAYEICSRADEYAKLSSKARSLMEFASMIDRLSETAENGSLGELFDQLMEETGYIEYLQIENDEFQTRKENIQEFKSMMVKFEEENSELGLSEFLEEVALYSDTDELDDSEDYVVLMTIHSAKGLEFKNVFVAGVEEGIFPSSQSMFDSREVEEERRLCYVAITRAKEKLHLTTAKRRMIYGSTSMNLHSRFIDEIPKELLEKIDETSKLGSFDFSAPRRKVYDFTERQSPSTHSSFDAVGFSAPKTEFKSADLNYSVGDTVKHKAFGEGLVLSMESMGGDTMVEIAFNKVGTKKLMANYAKLEKI